MQRPRCLILVCHFLEPVSLHDSLALSSNASQFLIKQLQFVLLPLVLPDCILLCCLSNTGHTPRASLSCIWAPELPKSFTLLILVANTVWVNVFTRHKTLSMKFSASQSVLALPQLSLLFQRCPEDPRLHSLLWALVIPQAFVCPSTPLSFSWLLDEDVAVSVIALFFFLLFG